MVSAYCLVRVMSSDVNGVSSCFHATIFHSGRKLMGGGAVRVLLLSMTTKNTVDFGPYCR